MEGGPKPMAELEYLLMLIDIMCRNKMPVEEVEARPYRKIADLWNDPNIEDRTRFRALFPGLDRPPKPREAIPVLGWKADENLNISGEPKAPR